METEKTDTPKPIRALLLDDNSFDRTRIRRMTERADMSMVVSEVPSIKEMSKKLEEEAYDLILIDYKLPEGDGLEALNIVQGNALNNGAATIMISGQEQLDVAVSAFRQGCSNFITKDELSAQVLGDAMQGALQTAKERLHSGSAFSDAVKNYLDSSMREAVNNGMVQDAMRDGLKKAFEELGFEAPKHDGKEVKEFWSALLDEDEFVL